MAELDILWRITDDWYVLRFRAPGTAFQATLAEVKDLPAWMRRWDRELLNGHGAWWISASGLAQLARLFRNYATLRAQADAAYAQWREEARAQEARQQARQTRRRGLPRQVAAAYRVLDLQPSASLTDIKQAYRGLAQVLHPDHGGKHTAMVALNAAYQIALAFAEAHSAA